MKSSTKSLLVGGGLLAASALLLLNSRKGTSSEEENLGTPGGMDEELSDLGTPNFVIQAVSGGIPDSNFSQAAPVAQPNTFIASRSSSPIDDSPFNFSSMDGSAKYIPPPTDNFSSNANFSSVSGKSVYMPPPPQYQDTASGGVLATIGVITGYGAANAGLIKVGEGVAKQSLTGANLKPVPASFTKTLTSDPYGVLSAAGKPAATQVAKSTPKLLKAGKFVGAYIPVLGIPAGAAVDRYLTKDTPDLQPSWGQAIVANTLGDLAQAGVVAGVTAGTGGIGTIGTYLVSPAVAVGTQEAYYKTQNKANIWDDVGLTTPKARDTQASPNSLLGGSSQAPSITPVASASPAMAFTPANANFSSVSGASVAIAPPTATAASSSSGGGSSSSKSSSSSSSSRTTSSGATATKSSFKSNLNKIKRPSARKS